MGKSLVIVESPAKAKTINKYLGKEFVVKSSIGHIRDLPTSGSDSGKFDNALELLVRSGRDIRHALMMMAPEAVRTIGSSVCSTYDSQATCSIRAVMWKRSRNAVPRCVWRCAPMENTPPRRHRLWRSSRAPSWSKVGSRKRKRWRAWCSRSTAEVAWNRER